MFTIKLVSLTPHPTPSLPKKAFVTFTLGPSSHSTPLFPLPSTSCDYTFSLPLLKSAFPVGHPVSLTCSAYASQGVVSSLLATAPPLGTGGQTVTTLCQGTGASFLDLTIPLDPLGTLRCLVAYKPHGIPPAVSDVVALESFARHPNVVLDPNSPLQVLAVNDNYLHVSYRLSSGRKGALKVHRNACFVIERLTTLDNLWNLALTPSDALLSTRVGSQVTRAARPMIEYGRDVARPAIFSARLGVAAVRTSVNATVKGVVAAGRTAGGVPSPAKF